jgi:predicted nucleic acid-binding protein
MRKILLDANVFIRVFNHDNNTTEEEYESAKNCLEALLEDDAVVVVVTPLIRHEVMRGLNRSDLSKIERVREAFDKFESIDINDQISECATKIYQILKVEDLAGKVEGRNPRKLGFDAMHVATAHIYDLEIISNDSDIEQLKRIIESHESDFNNQ